MEGSSITKGREKPRKTIGNTVKRDLDFNIWTWVMTKYYDAVESM